MSSSVTSRCVTARITVGWIVADSPTPRSGDARDFRSWHSEPRRRRPGRSSSRPDRVDAGHPRRERLGERDGHEHDLRQGARRGGRARKRRRTRRHLPGAWRRRTGASPATRVHEVREPARSAPNGHPSPFERQRVTVSKREAISAAGDALGDGGVEQACTVEMNGEPTSCAVATTASSSSSGQTRHPSCCACFPATGRCALVRGLRARLAASRTCSGVIRPATPGETEGHEPGMGRGASVLVDQDVRRAARRGERHRDAKSLRAIWFAIVAVGRKTRLRGRASRRPGPGARSPSGPRASARRRRQPRRSRGACPPWPGDGVRAEVDHAREATVRAWISRSSNASSSITASPPTAPARRGSGRPAASRPTRR